MKRFKVVARWVLAAIAVALLARTLLQADLGHALVLVKNLGPIAPALAIPALFVLALETIAWRVSLAPLRRPGHWHLARLRLATDAVLMSIPGGVVVSEYLIPVLLRDRCGMTLAEGTAASMARKWLGTRAHAFYIFLAATLGWGFLASRSTALPWLVVLGGAFPLAVSLAIELRGLGSLLAKVVPRVDGELERIIRQDRRTSWLATLLYLASWLCETLEAFVITRALGAHFSFVEILAIEAGLSVVRSMAFFAPSGIGVQDLGYVTLLGPIGPAFVLVKRARELVWIGVGWLLLARVSVPAWVSRGRAPSRSAREAPAEAQ